MKNLLLGSALTLVLLSSIVIMPNQDGYIDPNDIWYKSNPYLEKYQHLNDNTNETYIYFVGKVNPISLFSIYTANMTDIDLPENTMIQTLTVNVRVKAIGSGSREKIALVLGEHNPTSWGFYNSPKYTVTRNSFNEYSYTFTLLPHQQTEQYINALTVGIQISETDIGAGEIIQLSEISATVNY